MKRLGLGLSTRLMLLIVAVLVSAQVANAFLMAHVQKNARLQRTEAVVAERTAQIVRMVESTSFSERPLRRRPGLSLQDDPPRSGERSPHAEDRLRDALQANELGDRRIRVLMAEARGRPALVAAVELNSGRWLVTRQPLPPPSRAPWPMILVQTTILTIGLLLPALYIGQRVAKPLQELTAAADGFLTGAEAPPLPQGGPPDVQALRDAFAALQDRILAALEERSMMLGSIGHDLRTPLASLRIRVESVEDDALRDAMIESIESLNQALGEILSFSKSGAKELREEVRTDALLRLLEKDYAGRPVTVGEVAAATVIASPQSLLRALRNLVDNALRYGQCAEISVHSDNHNVMISVRDHGAGLEPHELDRLQKPFERGEGSRSRQSGGAGLGLAITKAVATAHDGRLELRNHEAGGLEALLVLPRAASGALRLAHQE